MAIVITIASAEPVHSEIINRTENYDLVIKNAAVLNVSSGQSSLQDVYVKGGRIVAIVTAQPSNNVATKKTVLADRKLLVPSFFDLHHHLNVTMGVGVEVKSQQELKHIQSQLARQYLSHGVTHIRSAGGKASNLPAMVLWENNQPNIPDYFSGGSAFVTLDTRFHNHVYLEDSSAIRKQITLYHALGIQNIKLYSLMDRNSVGTALAMAKSLGIRATGHIEGEMVSIEEAISEGLRQFEHVKTLFSNTYRQNQSRFQDASLPPDDHQNWLWREYEIFRLIGANDPLMDKLIQKLLQSQSSVTPTLHLYAKAVGMLENTANNLHQFTSKDWQGLKLANARKGYKQLQLLTLKLHKAGIRLHTGSDHPLPGLSILHEMHQLHVAGIKLQEVFRIASLNGAIALGLEENAGSIELNKYANFVLFQDNPITDSKALFGAKRVFKQGVEFKTTI